MSVHWTPPADWQQIEVIDAHTEGEPLRIITAGWPTIPGATILAKRRYAREHQDDLRRALMWEPRGHADMYGCIPTEPVTADGDLGVLFLHNEGFSTMCGHGIIGLTAVGLDTGLIDKPGDRPEVRIDSPAGRVTAVGHRENGRVARVSFRNVPSFVLLQDAEVMVAGIGRVRLDVAFGGAFYAYCRAADLGVHVEPSQFRALIDVGMRVKRAVMEQLEIRHPFEADLSFLYGTIIVDEAHDPAHHSRNVCIFADGEVDRCPTGTGVSGRAAIHHARGELAPDQPIVIESILGTTFAVSIVATTTFGPFNAVIPEVTGRAFITGHNRWLIDPADPLRGGFILR